MYILYIFNKHINNIHVLYIVNTLIKNIKIEKKRKRKYEEKIEKISRKEK